MFDSYHKTTNNLAIRYNLLASKTNVIRNYIISLTTLTCIKVIYIACVTVINNIIQAKHLLFANIKLKNNLKLITLII